MGGAKGSRDWWPVRNYGDRNTKLPCLIPGVQSSTVAVITIKIEAPASYPGPFLCGTGIRTVNREGPASSAGRAGERRHSTTVSSCSSCSKDLWQIRSLRNATPIDVPLTHLRSQCRNTGEPKFDSTRKHSARSTPGGGVLNCAPVSVSSITRHLQMVLP